MTDKSAPFTIFARNRPVRIAFLVDLENFGDRTDQLNDIIDDIVDFNNTHWGGRSNPIIFHQGDELTSSDWRLLELNDPDCVLAFTPIPQKLLASLDGRLHPWSIEVDDKRENHGRGIKIPFECSGIPTPPIPGHLARLRRPGSLLPDRNEKLLMFEFSENCEPDVKRFVHRNFGTFYQWLDPNGREKKARRIGWLERIMPRIQTHQIPISDRASLAAALGEMAGRNGQSNPRPPLPFLAPCQLASIGLDPHWTPSEYQNLYQVVVGDSPSDFAQFWGDIFYSMNWSRTYSSQLWVPGSLISDHVFCEALRNWLRSYTGSGANDRRVELVSRSVKADDLEKIRESFYSARPPLQTNATKPDFSERRRQAAGLKLTGPGRFVPWDSGTDAMRVAGIIGIERFSIPKPDLFDDEYIISGSWMTDLQVEHISRIETSGRENSWWTLPRLNATGLVQAMFKSPARINREGRFSVSIGSQNHSMARTVKPEITLFIPDDIGAVQWLLRDPHGCPALTSDVRYDSRKQRRPVVSSSRMSEKGANLNGLIELFGNFWTAKKYCERRFWRHLFSLMAGHGRGDDEKLQLRVRDLLHSEAFNGSEGSQEKSAVLASKFLHLVRGRLRGKHVTFKAAQELRSQLGKMAIDEPITCAQGNAIMQYHGIKALSRDEMQTGLDRLLELGVLRLGVEDMCPNCQTATWCHVDDMRQQSLCRGCGHAHSLRATEEWSYALNTLAQACVSQGVMGVLHALTALASYANNFFVFSPSLELFRDFGSQPWHEIDVLAILDGDFIIGEVKEGYVQKKTFDELAEVAELLCPQRAIIFLPASHANKQVAELNTWLTEMRARLTPKGISAELFVLPEF